MKTVLTAIVAFVAWLVMLSAWPAMVAQHEVISPGPHSLESHTQEQPILVAGKGAAFLRLFGIEPPSQKAYRQRQREESLRARQRGGPINFNTHSPDSVESILRRLTIQQNINGQIGGRLGRQAGITSGRQSDRDDERAAATRTQEEILKQELERLNQQARHIRQQLNNLQSK